MDNRYGTTERPDRPPEWDEGDGVAGRSNEGSEKDREEGVARPTHTETATEARQGWLDRPVLMVLLAGLALAAIFVIATQLWTAGEDTPEVPGLIDDGADAVEIAPGEAGGPAADLPAAP